MGSLFLLSLFLHSILTIPTESESPLDRRYHGVNIHFIDPLPGVLDQLSSAYSVVRTDLIWSSIEKQKGSYNFSAYDALISALLSHSPPVTPYLILDYGNPLYQDDEAPSTQIAIDAFVNFSLSAVTRYANQGIIFELWNEPNALYSWKPLPNATAYATLAVAVGSALKSHFPDEVLIGPATAEIDTPYIQKVFEYSNGSMLDYFDAISVHPYRPDGPESVLARYRELEELIVQFRGERVPIISGEWGYSTCWDAQLEVFIPCVGGARTGVNSYADQAKYLVRQWVLNDLLAVPISIFYDWKDDGEDAVKGEDNFGTVGYAYRNASAPYAPKLAFVAAVNYQRWVGDANRYQRIARIETVECASCNAKEVFAVEYVAEAEAASALFVVWNAELDPFNDQPVNVTVHVEKEMGYNVKQQVSCFDMFGEEMVSCVVFKNETQFVVNNVTDAPLFFALELAG